MDEYADYDGLGLAALVAAGEVTPGELLEAAVTRAQAAQAELNCFSALFPEMALDQIDTGLPSGPFTGVPFATKDLVVAIKGAPLTNGSRAFRGNIAAYDSVLTERYRAAGLTLFGQTTSPEFGITSSTESLLFGETRNPWDVTRTSGGSSGGAASAGDGADPEVMAEARKLMTQGKAPEAIRAAQASVEAATRPRHRFVRRLDLAEMCLAGGQARLARGIFGSLEREVAELGLSEWDPALAARCLEGVVKSIRAATQKGAPPDPAADLAFERLCRLDPAAAARLTKP